MWVEQGRTNERRESTDPLDSGLAVFKLCVDELWRHKSNIMVYSRVLYGLYVTYQCLGQGR